MSTPQENLKDTMAGQRFKHQWPLSDKTFWNSFSDLAAKLHSNSLRQEDVASGSCLHFLSKVFCLKGLE